MDLINQTTIWAGQFRIFKQPRLPIIRQDMLFFDDDPYNIQVAGSRWRNGNLGESGKCVSRPSRNEKKKKS